jgi:hypothetical protein
MGDSEALELTKRLERVERDVRRYRVALAVLGLVVLAAGILKAARPAGASGTPAVIQARKFQVVDGAGRVRAGLGMIGDDVGFALLDEAGKARAVLGMLGDDVALELSDKAGKLRAGLGNIDLHSPTGSTEHRAASSLVLFSEKEKVLWKAP